MNDFEDVKETIVIKYSVILAIIWCIAAIGVNIDLLENIFLGGWGDIFAAIALLIGLPAYLISFFIKRYNNLYVQCKMNVRKASIYIGVAAGVCVYAILMLIFFFIADISATGIYSTAALITGCISAYRYLKNHRDMED